MALIADTLGGLETFESEIPGPRAPAPPLPPPESTCRRGAFRPALVAGDVYEHMVFIMLLVVASSGPQQKFETLTARST